MKTCIECTKKGAEYQEQRRDGNIENTRNPQKPAPAVQPSERLEMNIEQVLELIETHRSSAIELDVIANLEGLIDLLPDTDSETPLDVFNASVARQIARAVWERTKYR